MSLAQDIESRIQILDIVNRYVSTKKAGVNYKGLCPFHTEKSPSFVISPQKNIAHCFSCGKGGGPINFLMEIEKIDFREAASILAKEAGIEMSTNFAREKAENGQDVYALYREATDWYNRMISHTENERALTYLLQRGITRETIDKFQLGYSGSPRDLLYFLKEKGFDSKFLIDSGLFVSESRDKFFGRIVFPIANTMGHTVAFTGRVMDDSLPKYLNSPASHIFDKSSILYGLHLAKQAISKSGEVYIVEGQMDTIALHQAGVENSVGISGTALTKEHIRILRRFATTIYLALDSDNAGVKATFASIENLLNEDIEIKVIHIPNGKDPDEYTKSGGDFTELKNQKNYDEYNRMLKIHPETAMSVVEFYIQEGHREFDTSTIIGKKKLIEKCLEVIARINSPIEANFYIQQLGKRLDISGELLFSEYNKVRMNVQRKKGEEAKGGQKSGLLRSSQGPEPSNHQTIKPSNHPTFSDLIAGYIFRYDFLDLFFREFRYTISDLEHIEGAGLLSRLTSQNTDSSDNEALCILDLRLEEEHALANPELIQRAFRDMLRILHIELLAREKNTLLSGIDPNSSEYLKLYSELIQKEKTFIR